MNLSWKGKGINEVGYLNGRPSIFIDKKYFRPTEVENLLGNSSKAKKELSWKPKYNIYSLVKEMVSQELLFINDKKK